MTYRLSRTRYFERRVARFVRRYPHLRGRLAELLRQLAADPSQAHLRLQPLRGELAGLHAASVTHEHRVLLTLRLSEGEILFIDIGTHDEVYRPR